MVIAEVHQRCNCVSAASWECRCKLWNFTISWMHSSMITYTLNSAVSIFPTSLQGLDSYWAIGPYHRPNGHSAQSTGPLKMAQNELGQFGPQIFILGHFERWVCEYGTSIQNRCVAVDSACEEPWGEVVSGLKKIRGHLSRSRHTQCLQRYF